MLSPSDYNSAVPQFTNGDYASNPLNPLYIEEPDATNYNRGVEPLQTLPAQWWNWFGKQFTNRFNKLNIYVKNIFNELAQLLSLVNITPDGTEGSPTISQLKGAFQTEYPKLVALTIYPVGALFWTSKAPNDGGDPNVLFGGTWVQIKGCFVWAKGDSDTANATGGSKTKTLIEDNLPSHRHTIDHTHTHSHTHDWSNTHNHPISDPGHAHLSNAVSNTAGANKSYVVANFYKDGIIWNDANFVRSNTTGITVSNKTISGTTDAPNDSTTSGPSTTYSGYTGTATAFDVMPPYVVKYCWERTA